MSLDIDRGLVEGTITTPDGNHDLTVFVHRDRDLQQGGRRPLSGALRGAGEGGLIDHRRP